MNSFYGGINGQSFSIKAIFSNYQELLADEKILTKVGIGEYALISYGFTALEYEENEAIDNQNYNATLWQKDEKGKYNFITSMLGRNEGPMGLSLKIYGGYNLEMLPEEDTLQNLVDFLTSELIDHAFKGNEVYSISVTYSNDLSIRYYWVFCTDFQNNIWNRVLLTGNIGNFIIENSYNNTADTSYSTNYINNIVANLETKVDNNINKINNKTIIEGSIFKTDWEAASSGSGKWVAFYPTSLSVVTSPPIILYDERYTEGKINFAKLDGAILTFSTERGLYNLEFFITSEEQPDFDFSFVAICS